MAPTELDRLPRLTDLVRRVRWRPERPAWQEASPVSVVARKVWLDPTHVDGFIAVCGGPEAPRLPLTFPHALLTPLHAWLLLDPGFPFPALGVVHRSERIVRRRTLAVGTPVRVQATVGGYHQVPSGVAFTVRSTLSQDDEVVWAHTTTAVRRIGSGTVHPYLGSAPRHGEQEESWRVPSGTGRRYGLVSGNLDPIHLSSVTAWPFGFPRAVVHGMWTASRAVSAIVEPFGAATLDVRFRQVLTQPARVELVRQGTRFAVWPRRGDRPVLEGSLTPTADDAELVA